MSNKIKFITGNKNKFKEVKAIMPDIEQMDIDLAEIQEIDAEKIIGAKLLEAVKQAKGPLMAEDTSLYLECLNGLPGPLIKWFLVKLGNDGLYKIAEKLGNFNAEARTIIGYSDGARKIKFFTGSIKGHIIPPQGVTSFGWDPIFQPEGYLKSFAELGSEEKNEISMRRMAVEKLKKYLEKQ